jgi:hypothetical protein
MKIYLRSLLVVVLMALVGMTSFASGANVTLECPKYDPKGHLKATITAGSNPFEWVATITNSSNCKYDVGFASYKKYDNVLKNQELFSQVEAMQIGNGKTTLTLTAPQCATQLDVVFDATYNFVAATSGNSKYSQWMNKQVELDMVPMILPTFYSGAYGPHGQRYGTVSDGGADRLLAALHPAKLAFCVIEEPTEEPTEVPTEVPTEIVTEVPTEIVTEVPTEIVTEVPTEIVTEVPTEIVTEVPTEIVTEVPTEIVTEVPTEIVTEVPTEVVTEVPTEVVTEVPTEVVTEVPTEVVTEVPTEVVTEVPTEVVTEVPTEVVTEVPTEVVTEVPTEVVTEEPVCKPIDPQKDLWATIEFVSGNTYKAVIRNDGKCDYTVGFASYKKFNNNLEKQVLFSSVEGVAKPGITELTLEIPQCQAQLDVVYDASHNYEAYAGGTKGYNKWADKQAQLDMVPVILPSFYSDMYGPYGNTYSSAGRLLKALHTTTPFCVNEEPTEVPTEIVTEIPTEEPTEIVTDEPNACGQINPDQHIWASISHEGGNSYKATITNDSDCVYTVGFAAYEMSNDKLKDQVLFNSATTSIGRGTHTLTITAPQCKAQLDVVYDAIHNYEAARDGVASYSEYADDQAALDAVPVILNSFYSGIPFGDTYSEVGRLMKKLITDNPYCGVVVTEVPTEVPTEEPTDVATEVPTEIVTEVPTEVVTETPTDIVTEVPTQVTEQPTEVVTEVPTQVTEQPTEIVTEVPTQVTEQPTEVVTEEATEMATESDQ